MYLPSNVYWCYELVSFSMKKIKNLRKVNRRKDTIFSNYLMCAIKIIGRPKKDKGRTALRWNRTQYVSRMTSFPRGQSIEKRVNTMASDSSVRVSITIPVLKIINRHLLRPPWDLVPNKPVNIRPFQKFVYSQSYFFPRITLLFFASIVSVK